MRGLERWFLLAVVMGLGPLAICHVAVFGMPEISLLDVVYYHMVCRVLPYGMPEHFWMKVE